MNQHRDPRSADPFDRLRAADPAVDVTPDLASLEAAVRARVDDGPRSLAGSDELAAARGARRPNRWLAVAAVAAGTLVVGSAGYALGDRPDGELTATEGSATSEITLPGVERLAPEATGPAAGPAAPNAGPVVESITADSMPWFGARTVFTAQGLSDTPGTAAAWSFDPRAVFAPETAARVAAALGLTGEPRLEAGVWVVGPQDGTGPNLQLMPDGTATVAYYDPTRDPWGCPVVEPDSVDPAEGGMSSPAGPECTTTEFGPAPQGDAAIARAREVLSGAGVDPDAFEYEVMDAGMAEVAYVTAYGTLNGQRTGLSWNVTLVGDGVQSVYGYLAPLVPLGDYEVISPVAAVARLADPRFSSVGGPIMAAGREPAMTEPSEDPGAGAGTDAAGPREVPTPPAAPEPGSTFAWPVTDVVLTSARLGLAQQTEPDGAAVLVPAYELSSDDGMTWSVVAVTDAALDFAAAP